MRRFGTFLAGILMIAAIGLTGCSTEEKSKDWRENAKENAKVYLQNKYGIDASVESARSLTDTFGKKTYKTSDTLVTLTYADKTIQVQIDGDEDADISKGRDDYQYEDFVDSMKEYISSLCGTDTENIMIYIPKDHLYNATFNNGTDKLQNILDFMTVEQDQFQYGKTVVIVNFSLDKVAEDFSLEETVTNLMQKLDAPAGMEYIGLCYNTEEDMKNNPIATTNADIINLKLDYKIGQLDPYLNGAMLCKNAYNRLDEQTYVEILK